MATVAVKPELIRWAIDRSGLSVENFPPMVAEWLDGNRKPTLSQLESFSKRAMAPLGYLFLPKPPDERLPIPDYRTRTDRGVRRPSPNLIETIFEMERRQEWMKEYLIEEGHEELPFVGSAKIGDNVTRVAKLMRTALKLGDDWANKQGNWEEALRYLRERIEEAGVLIFANGIVGNNTSRKLSPDEFQGFVFVDKMVPLIFVNGADFKSAQMFTIAHELSHVWVGQSALFDLTATQPANFEIERYCNILAAEFLVPAELLLSAWPKSSVDDFVFANIARRFKVSPIVVARRAKDCNLISSEHFFSYYQRSREREHNFQVDRKPGGDFWLTQNVRLGRRFGRAVIVAARDGRLSYSDAYALTRLRGDTFDKYASLLDGEIRR